MQQHPEIAEIEIARPIFIVGQPRTGTTHMHNLMAEDPALRSLPYWESLEPVLSDDEQAAVARGETDPRRERCAVGLELPQRRAPLLQAHARHDRRPRARGDPAPRARGIDDALRDHGRDARVARLVPRSRPDGPVRVHEEGAPVLPVAARRRAVGAEVTPARRADPGAARCVPRRDLRVHPPRPGLGDRLDRNDDQLLVSVQPGKGRPAEDRALLGRPRRDDAARRDRRPPPAPGRSEHRRALRRVHGRRSGDGRTDLRRGRPTVHTRSAVGPWRRSWRHTRAVSTAA